MKQKDAERIEKLKSVVQKWTDIFDKLNSIKIDVNSFCAYCNVYVECDKCPLYLKKVCGKYKDNNIYARCANKIDETIKEVKNMRKAVAEEIEKQEKEATVVMHQITFTCGNCHQTANITYFVGNLRKGMYPAKIQCAGCGMLVKFTLWSFLREGKFFIFIF